MLATTSDEIPGQLIAENLGVVRGISVGFPNLLQMLQLMFQVMGVGHVNVMAELSEATHDEACLRMEQQAAERGATAIIGVRYNAALSNLPYVQAYGTAVTLTPAG